MSLKEHPKVNEWLTCVETEMRTTLASMLADAVKDVQQFSTETIDPANYMNWVDTYNVSTHTTLHHATPHHTIDPANYTNWVDTYNVSTNNTPTLSPPHTTPSTYCTYMHWIDTCDVTTLDQANCTAGRGNGKRKSSLHFARAGSSPPARKELHVEWVLHVCVGVACVLRAC